MLKKIVAFLVLASFLISSHMQLVHAFVMQEMIHGDTWIHEMGAVEHAMFCDTKSDPSKNYPECLKATSQEKIVPAKSELENNKKGQLPKYTLFISNEWWKVFRVSSIIANSPSTTPPRVDRQTYTALIGIVKNLN